MILYKYRGFSNLEFALDIFVNQRLFAADFRNLNDPMEGTFTYSRDLVDRNELRNILGEKSQYKILSLSETPNNMLMWSYYAEAHKGFVVGVEITDSSADTQPVEYVNNFSLDNNSNNRAKSILTKKLKLWTHEKEQRVFIQYEPFIKVEIKELIFGLECEPRQRELLTKIAKSFCPHIEIKTISRDELDRGQGSYN